MPDEILLEVSHYDVSKTVFCCTQLQMEPRWSQKAYVNIKNSKTLERNGRSILKRIGIYQNSGCIARTGWL